MCAQTDSDRGISWIAQAVKDLRWQGYAFVPILGNKDIANSLGIDSKKFIKQSHDVLSKRNNSTIELLDSGLLEFVGRRKSYSDFDNWQVTVPGEKETDLGIIFTDGARKDHKYFFHYHPILTRSLGKVFSGSLVEADRVFMQRQQILYEVASVLEEMILDQFQRVDGIKTLELFRMSCAQSQKYSTSVLRSLYYPVAPNQKGARPHVDRSLLTVHFGDHGGQLLALSGSDDETGIPVSPPPGHAVIFFGVKVLWVTGGRMRPLWHKSITKPGEERFAQVFFGHVPIRGYDVVDAIKAEADFWQHYKPLIDVGKYQW